jgi:hypothetical protein
MLLIIMILSLLIKMMTTLRLLREKSNMQTGKRMFFSCYSSTDSPFIPPLSLLLLHGSISFPSASLHLALAKFNTLKYQHCDTFRRYLLKVLFTERYFVFFVLFFSTASSASPQIPICWRMLIEPRTVETLAFAVRCSNRAARSHHFKVIGMSSENLQNYTSSNYTFAVQDRRKGMSLQPQM